MKEKIGLVFSIATDNSPVPGCTISKEIASAGENTITCFSLAPQTDISAEIFPYYKFLIVEWGSAEIYTGSGNVAGQIAEGVVLESARMSR